MAGSASLGSLGANTTTAPTAGTMPMSGSTSTSFGNLSDPATWTALTNNPQQLDSWIASQAPWMTPQLRKYYAGVIHNQPGANPTEQAGSANYYMQKFAADPNAPGGGQGGARGVSSANPNGIPGLDPGFDFQVQQAQNAIQRSAASKGTLLTGGTLKGLADYIGNDMASSAYQGAFGRSLSLAQLGENAAAGQGQNNSGYANGATGALTGNANAQGAASIANGNAINGALTNVGNAYTLSKLFPPAGTLPAGGVPQGGAF